MVTTSVQISRSEVADTAHAPTRAGLVTLASVVVAVAVPVEELSASVVGSLDRLETLRIVRAVL